MSEYTLLVSKIHDCLCVVIEMFVPCSDQQSYSDEDDAIEACTHIPFASITVDGICYVYTYDLEPALGFGYTDKNNNRKDVIRSLINRKLKLATALRKLDIKSDVPASYKRSSFSTPLQSISSLDPVESSIGPINYAGCLCSLIEHIITERSYKLSSETVEELEHSQHVLEEILKDVYSYYPTDGEKLAQQIELDITGPRMRLMEVSLLL